MKILITGTNGYIGQALLQGLNKEWTLTPLTRQEADLTNLLSLKNFLQDKYFDVIIHCAVSGGKRTDIDSVDILDNNLQMYYNLIKCREHFGKFIYFGSGAEKQDTFYGLSKKVMLESIQGKDNFYNIRVYAVFDEFELDSRFIKTNIKKYLQKEPISIFKNKTMDFFYMEDLILLVEHYISTDILPKEIDCTYNSSETLLSIAQKINTLDNYTVPIILQSEDMDSPYNGTFVDLGIKYIGLLRGIEQTYQRLK